MPGTTARCPHPCLTSKEVTIFIKFQNLWFVIHGWRPERHEISWTDEQIANWVRMQK